MAFTAYSPISLSWERNGSMIVPAIEVVFESIFPHDLDEYISFMQLRIERSSSESPGETVVTESVFDCFRRSLLDFASVKKSEQAVLNLICKEGQ